VVTFVGILASEAVISDGIDDPTEVPTLHVLFSRSHSSSLVRHQYPSSDDSIHDDLVDWIAEEGLNGDHEAAEWVLLACIAKVFGELTHLALPLLRLPTDSQGGQLYCPLHFHLPDFLHRKIFLQNLPCFTFFRSCYRYHYFFRYLLMC